MFCGKLKNDHQVVTLRLVETERDLTALRNELAKLENERDIARAEAKAARAECDVAREIFAEMQNFGVSFVELQRSQGAAAILCVKKRRTPSRLPMSPSATAKR